MHTRFLFIFDKDIAKNSKEARKHTSTYLTDEGFVGQGRWSTGYGDWFVIGGRWSGELTLCHLDSKKFQTVHKQFEKQHGWYLSTKISVETRRKQYRALFLKMFPEFKGEVPEWRDEFADLGYDDDAMIVDQIIYDKILMEFEGDVDGEFHCVEERDPVDKTFIGNKWIVVVDYHQ